MSIFTKLENEIKAGLKALESFFTSGKAQAAIQEAASLVNEALPIVQAIDAAMGGNPTVEKLEALYQEYAIPFEQAAANNLGNAMLNLATSILQKQLPAGKAVTVLNTAVQLAVTALHAQTA